MLLIALILPNETDLRIIPIPEEAAVAAPYFITPIEASPKQANAALFVNFVLNEGQAILSHHGFSSLP